MRTISKVSTVVVALVALSGCDGMRAECSDGIDNDGDGFVDAQDPACAYWSTRQSALNANCGQAQGALSPSNPACQVSVYGGREGDDPACYDRKDNDGDGLVDAADPGCQDANGNPVAPTTLDDDETNPECSDGQDNDGDGLTDMQDPACVTSAGAWVRSGSAEAADPVCANGRDDDGDGAIDFPADAGCASATDGTENNPQCADGIDNDGDGATDFPADSDCFSALQDREWPFACADGVDNDWDGAVDYPDDPGCATAFDNSEANPACSDNRDNDGDGLVDFPMDPGCASASDGSEAQPQCSDGLDNDGDGLVDFPEDPSCVRSDDNSETSVCADGVDNDGDGLVDFPDDPECDSFDGGSEGGVNVCADGLDNDGDGLTDYPNDPGCATIDDATESDGRDVGDCNDGIDNDGDGLIDRGDLNHDGTAEVTADPACAAGYLWERLDPRCNDGVDNDGDGRADFLGVDRNLDGAFDGPGEFPPDPGCLSASGYAETVKPACADGVDNDGDGTADWAGIDLDGDGQFTGAGELPPDYACTVGEPAPIDGMRRRYEDTPRQCYDGVDNDGDGFFDYQPEFLAGGAPNPAYLTGDPQCSSYFDNLEAN